ncbi:hypothetical protein PF008_g30476 [Phytophthora fragariae]|uniref:SCP domain-containing protein n=1 Tax=Phytophthora fragariae TaxID=53985 RepID=A0A6G0Q5Y3_9STRA|nr:hypothetical protein PF008_g30476 [Phytophthora fragariae]
MTITQTSLALLIIAAAASNGLSEAANLRQAQRHLAATYRQPSEYLPAMVTRVNKERAAVGLPPVCANLKLQSSSQRHSDDMADHDYMAPTTTWPPRRNGWLSNSMQYYGSVRRD